MTSPPDRWAAELESPIFVLTADQDWAPEWAIESLLAEVRRRALPLHVFRTSPSLALDLAARSGQIEQGWHPNFLPGSSQGATAEAAIAYCAENFPRATTVRSHRYAEDSTSWRLLRAAGIIADSQPCSLFQGSLEPIVHWTGIVRFPVYFEDDNFMEIGQPDLALSEIEGTLFTPGLKILNFHPTFVGCNTPSRVWYEERKARIFAPDSTARELRWPGRGIHDVFCELIEHIRNAGQPFVPFQSLVGRVSRLLRQCGGIVPPGLARYLG